LKLNNRPKNELKLKQLKRPQGFSPISLCFSWQKHHHFGGIVLPYWRQNFATPPPYFYVVKHSFCCFSGGKAKKVRLCFFIWLKNLKFARNK
jgi:hypothetical protein